MRAIFVGAIFPIYHHFSKCIRFLCYLIPPPEKRRSVQNRPRYYYYYYTTCRRRSYAKCGKWNGESKRPLQQQQQQGQKGKIRNEESSRVYVWIYWQAFFLLFSLRSPPWRLLLPRSLPLNVFYPRNKWKLLDRNVTNNGGKGKRGKKEDCCWAGQKKKRSG